ncbi:hypothetical protein ANN_23509 [Periplaneta americana]|uniref:Uncharacterized protein n=1 Tax=Periplaneta americana TaxID=6978 RepID=A0ABQ8SLB6_PERAM|nr:hypothetical protein ANN_23509 [Periplaneta americana]
MTAIDPSSSFVPIPLQRDVIVVHRSELGKRGVEAWGKRWFPVHSPPALNDVAVTFRNPVAQTLNTNALYPTMSVTRVNSHKHGISQLASRCLAIQVTSQRTGVQPMTSQLCTVIKPQVSIILGYAIERELAKSHGGWKSNTVAEATGVAQSVKALASRSEVALGRGFDPRLSCLPGWVSSEIFPNRKVNARYILRQEALLHQTLLGLPDSKGLWIDQDFTSDMTQHGAPPHYYGGVRDFLNAWPPRSTDLTPIDLSLGLCDKCCVQT